ncbi:MAG: class I SAM-dependent methyltransferase [Rhodospirillales bacterium]|nr:class I SAM-dependent methyltransferase [Rhodospirillales bacterium]
MANVATADFSGLSRPLRLLLKAASRIEVGALTVAVPNGRNYAAIGPRPGPLAAITIRRAATARRVLIGGNVGFAESYMDGDWETPDLAALLELACANEQALGAAHYGNAVLRLLRRFQNVFRANTRRGARRNIASHYDLSNAFYARWLDPTMTYSSAVFAKPGQDLADAQLHKFRRLAEKLDLRPGHRLLEIGCGWGGFATFAAREFGALVTAITISRAQLAHVRERVVREGLGDRIEVRFCDYRDLRETFDRIVSIEMFEAVGEKYWPTYFAKIRDCLVPGGRAALQIITIADRWFDSYRKGVDFIQRYIFPGGMLPSPAALRREIGRVGLALDRQEFFGSHYARTLAEWNRRFQAAWPEIVQLGFDQRFKRMWEFYLAYCEAGFRTGSIDVTQVSLIKP